MREYVFRVGTSLVTLVDQNEGQAQSRMAKILGLAYNDPPPQVVVVKEWTHYCHNYDFANALVEAVAQCELHNGLVEHMRLTRGFYETSSKKGKVCRADS